jgi:SagB-type dehydrogenase family enzyme
VNDHDERVALPAPALSGAVSLEEALAMRRSVRRFSSGGLELARLGQLLWAAQGVTDAERGFRTAPSAGAHFPLRLYAVARDVDGIGAGVYLYAPADHALVTHIAAHVEEELCAAALQQPAIRGAAVTLAFTAVTGRTSAKYGERGSRDVMLDLGHAAQNVLLQVTALGLGAVALGAFDEVAAARVLRLEGTEEPLYLIAVGRV